jgi:hypothetical protein
VFPADNYWHADIRGLPVDAHSAQWLAAMGASSHNLHPDFGPSYGEQPVPYGIPVTVVPAGHPRVSVVFDYADESDKLPYPLGTDTLIEGGANADGDRHAIVVTADTCELFETWDTHSSASGWTAGSGAHWSLTSDALRPDGWTSADAAGLPILPGLLRWDEVAAGHVNHAIRFTTNLTDATHLWPARHDASSHHDGSLPPMGARFRLKASFDISKYSPQTQVVLRDADLRPGARRQRFAVVLPRHRRQRVARHRDLAAEDHPGERVRGRRYEWPTHFTRQRRGPLASSV